MDINYYGYLQTLMHYSVGLITILNPIAAAAIMISSSPSNLTKEDADEIGKKATLTVVLASLITIFLGNIVFDLFGINSSSVMVIGGIVLLLMSIQMVQGKIPETSHSVEESKVAMLKENISVIPIGIPILFGPGVISTLMIFKAKSSNIVEIALLLIAVMISGWLIYLTLRNAIFLTKVLGVSGLKIMTRIMGLIVGAIAAQFIIFGIKALW
ncbi:MAG: NAAT family transporter [Sulfuricurvum sp.]|uniref:MarC family protein n=1 Tax=Sulfuricurvum sp. TaxID=2025608 RepID=UPI002611A616|nr:NAAT family transporter [Sulfuricurvum sp.]MDD2368256.1 NAAT family transporter [Sulfuricurvum sp.]MDD5117382.1 NAAT family transporter [Sulfuricurvum sp.]